MGRGERGKAMKTHQSDKVQKAIEALENALVEFERNTGRQSVVILREEGGFVRRSVSGKPCKTERTDLELVFAVIGVEEDYRHD